MVSTCHSEIQGSAEPTDEWVKEYGVLMHEMLRWMPLAYPDLPKMEYVNKMEEIFRAIRQQSRTAPHMDHTTVDRFFLDLPEKLRNQLKSTMQHGVQTGIPRFSKTNSAIPTATATRNAKKVWKQFKQFMSNESVLEFPPESRSLLEHCGLQVVPTHFVEQTTYKDERLVIHLSNAGEVHDDRDDSNSASIDQGYDEVQTDYLDWLIDELVEYLKLSSEHEKADLAQLKADIKSAFLRIPLHLTSVGTLCMEFEGWLFVFVVTPFGWIYATHTFSPFSKAIKLKTRHFNQTGWHSVTLFFFVP